MLYYYCTCCNDLGKTNEGKSPYREVEADKEGICKNCGYYAIATKEPIGNSRGVMILYLRITNDMD